MFDVDKSLKTISRELRKLKDNNIIRSKRLVGDLGEYYATQLCGISLNDNKNETGYDGRDAENLKVEIKTRTNPAPQAKVKFSKVKFRYCLFIVLDDFFGVHEIYKVSRYKVVNNFEKNYNRLSVSKLMGLGERIYPDAN